MDIAVRISNENRIPIYVQIANQFKTMIATGELKKGDALPGREVLAKHLGVNINTVNHAYRILENEGFIYSKRGIGSFVNPQVEGKSKTEAVAILGELGFTNIEIASLLRTTSTTIATLRYRLKKRTRGEKKADKDK